MADTVFGNSDVQNVINWSKLTFREALKRTRILKYIGDNKRSIIQRLKELDKGNGDTIRYDLLVQMASDGVSGHNTLVNNEEALVYYQDSVVVQVKRNAHRFDGLSQQRTIHDLRKDGKDNLADWCANWIDTTGFRMLCGDTTMTHGSTGAAPDSAHYVVSGDVSHTGTIATDEASLGSNDQIDLMDLDYAKEKARTISPMVEPVRINGDDFYVFIGHEYSITDLRTSANTNATIKWSEIQSHANVRGEKNPLFTGSNGVYNKIIIDDSTRIYSPVSNVRRNLFLGAQAGVVAFANPFDKIDKEMYDAKLPLAWAEEVRDYRFVKGIAAAMCVGIKACRFNSKNYGAMVITSYSAAHT
jgi:N4-gp56 family major capsid protein